MRTPSEELLHICNTAQRRIIIPLDYSTIDQATKMVDLMADEGIIFFKIGLELISTGEFASLVKHILHDIKGMVFLDGKLNDIPNTVASAVRNLTRMRVDLMNVHCLAGVAAMKAAVDAADEEWSQVTRGFSRPAIIGVTVLTSLDYDAIYGLGLVRRNPKWMSASERKVVLKAVVIRLALLAKEAGLDGVVASAQHVVEIKAACGTDFLVVTPGIRFADGDRHDQKQVATPVVAARKGSDLQVIGRAITKPADGNIAGAIARATMEIEEGLTMRTA